MTYTGGLHTEVVIHDLSRICLGFYFGFGWGMAVARWGADGFPWGGFPKVQRSSTNKEE